MTRRPFLTVLEWSLVHHPQLTRLLIGVAMAALVVALFWLAFFAYG